MFKSGSTKLVRSLNKQHVLNLVRMNPGISARDISITTSLQMSTVLYTLKALKSEGVVKEIGIGDSTVQGGKPPVMWDITSEYGFVFGLELLSTEARLVLLNFKGEEQFKNIFPINLSNDPNHIADQVEVIINEVLEEQNLSENQILGMGIGIPGTVDSENGIVAYSYAFDFHNIKFRDILSSKFSFDVEIDNDANAGALGIKWLSRSEFMVKHILYLSINQNFSGIGAGFILNHELYSGINGAAGEIKTFLDKTTWKRFLKNARDKFGEDCIICNGRNDNVLTNISDVILNAKKGDKGSIFILKEVAKELSKKIILLVDLLNPEVIIIGGDMCDAEEYISSLLRERVEKYVLSEAAKKTPIKFSPFGTYSGAMGGTALIFKKIFIN